MGSLQLNRWHVCAVDETEGSEGGLGTGAVVGIAAGGGLVLLALGTALCCCFNARCSAACCGSTRHDKLSSKGKGKDDLSSGMVRPRQSLRHR